MRDMTPEEYEDAVLEAIMDDPDSTTKVYWMFYHDNDLYLYWNNSNASHYWSV